MNKLRLCGKMLAQDRATERRDQQWLNLLGLSTAILSALAAIAAMQAGYLANEGTLAQLKAADAWSDYQAQSTKRHLAESDILSLTSLQRPIPTDLQSQIQTLQQKQAALQIEAQTLQQESANELQQHELFARSVAALQVAISLGAVAVLLRKRAVWYVSLGIAAIGLRVACQVLLFTSITAARKQPAVKRYWLSDVLETQHTPRH